MRQQSLQGGFPMRRHIDSPSQASVCPPSSDLLQLFQPRLLDPLKVRADSGRTAERLPGGLSDQLADDRWPFACDVPEPIPVARLVLRRDQSEIPAYRLGM